MTPSINSAPSIAAPATAWQSSTASTAQAPAGIVSVNARGARANRDGAKATAVVLIFALAVVGGLYGFNQYRAYLKAKEAQAIEDAKAENKAAQVAQRRKFSTDPRPTPPAATAIPALAPNAPAKPPPVPIPVVPAPRASGQQTVSRFGGEVIVPPKGAIGAGADSIPTEASRDRSVEYRRVLATYSPTDPARASAHGLAGGQAGGSARAAPAGMTRTSLAGSSHAVLERPVPASRPEPIRTAQVAGVFPGQPGGDSAGAFGGTQYGPAPGWPAMPPSMNPLPPDAGVPNTRGKLDELLKSEKAAKARATMLGDRDLILPRGKTIDCSLATRIVNEVSGMAECTVASNVYSDNGRVVLIERGSQASGEYIAAMAMGQRRLFVLWTRIKTPTGVVIDLDSPAADALGGAGLPGYIDNRWVDRIGAAVMLSMVQDAIAYAAATRSSADVSGIAQFQFNNTRQVGNRLVEQILAQTIAIRPTLYKNQGDRASIYVARDLDFESVYALRAR